jgi:pimeloyl-ACP methyl ester carboxylesterase
LDLAKIGRHTKSLVITGEEDKICPPEYAARLGDLLSSSDVQVLSGVGHWHVFEDGKRVSSLLRGFLSM